MYLVLQYDVCNLFIMKTALSWNGVTPSSNRAVLDQTFSLIACHHAVGSLPSSCVLEVTGCSKTED